MQGRLNAQMLVFLLILNVNVYFIVQRRNSDNKIFLKRCNLLICELKNVLTT